MKTRGKNIWIVPAYMIFYLISFCLLERMQVKHYIIQCSLDQKIPFCEYFIVPYVLWFFMVAGTVGYFAFMNESPGEYGRLISTLAAGMTMFLVISFVCPNMHLLRQKPVGESMFADAVRLLQRVDTPTNVFPSIHVFNAVACCVALRNNEACRRRKWFMAGMEVLTISIILSTMFLKQHSIIDVVGALVLNWVCYGVFYKWMPEKQEILSGILSREQILTIPNGLSLVRLMLAVFFWGISYRGHIPGQQAWLVSILCLSGISDFLDGQIARKYNMSSEFGKILDPIADKVTQGVLLLHLMGKYELLEIIVILFIIKEFCMLALSSRVLEEKQRNDGAQWYGKINTAVFYAVMIPLTLFPRISMDLANMMICFSGICMVYAFIKYVRFYRELLAAQNDHRKVC